MSPGWIQQFSQLNKGLLTSAVSPALGLGEKYIEMERTVVCSSREDCNPWKSQSTKVIHGQGPNEITEEPVNRECS